MNSNCYMNRNNDPIPEKPVVSKNIKQVIVMRHDLHMRLGKCVAQGCHASMKVFFDNSEGSFLEREFQNIYPDRRKGTTDLVIVGITSEMVEWIDGIFTKICVRVDSEEQLMEIYNKAKEAGLPCSLIEDNGLTEFNGVKTKTCCGIGPANAEDIDKITGELKLL